MPPSRAAFTLLALLASASLAAQTNPVPSGGATEVTVTGSRVGAQLRPVTVISGAELRALPVTDTATALSYVAGVDLRERSPFGGQADVNLFGSTFEDVLILVDGFPVNDPQTGHHDLELLPPLEAIDRIEVLEGPAAATYGPGAFGGVIQIITRRPSQAPSGEASILRGDYGLTRGGALGQASGLLAAGSLLSTTGFRPDTEERNGQGFVRALVGSLDLEAGFQDKRFGAWQAYSDAFPDEWEAVRGGFGRLLWTGGPWQFVGGFRHKSDHFILDRQHPGWYDAFHSTDGLEGQLTRRLSLPGGAAIVGIEGARDSIASNFLGHHSRSRAGLFGEGFWRWGRTSLDAGLRVESLQGTTRGMPQLTISRALSADWSGFLSTGRSFRLPSFTELYSYSPAYAGNPRLSPETAWETQAGFKGRAGRTAVAVSLFYRDGSDLIDFVRRAGTTDPFVARNVQHLETTGLLAQASGPLGKGFDWIFSTTLLTQSTAWPARLESRYAGDTVRHREVAGLTYRGSRLTASLFVRAWQRLDQDGHGELDASLRWSPPGTSHLGLFAEGRNLTNHPDLNFYGGEGPGRWLWAGVSLR